MFRSGRSMFSILKWKRSTSATVIIPQFRSVHHQNLLHGQKLLTVCIVGRPNVGKSTLFNRITSSRAAIVSNIPGTTRDRKEGKGVIAGLPLKIIDTGGLDDRGAVSSDIQMQVGYAFKESDVIVFMLDARAGVTSLDEHFAQWIRKISSKQQPHGETEKKVILVANKTEGAHLSSQVLDTVSGSYGLGFGEPLLISASHGDGMADLAQELIIAAQAKGLDNLKEISADEDGSLDADGVPILENRVIQLAIMGRPNVGKSTLLNAFVQEERAIAGPMPGLTRDSVQTEWEHSGRRFRLVDTAGLTRIRSNPHLLATAQQKEKRLSMIMDASTGSIDVGRHYVGNVKLPGRNVVDKEDDPSQLSYQISEYALLSALNALNHAQVVLLVVEATQGKFAKLDLQLAQKCLQEGRALVVAANKVDTLRNRGVSSSAYEESVQEHIGHFMREFGAVPVVATSGWQGKGVQKVLDTVINVHDAWSKRISTGLLNKWLKDLLITNPMPRVGGKKLNLKYITQVKSRPPTFALFMNTEEIPGMFECFLRSNLQHAFGLNGVPIRFIVHRTAISQALIPRKRRKDVRDRSARVAGQIAAASVRRRRSLAAGIVAGSQEGSREHARSAGGGVRSREKDKHVLQDAKKHDRRVKKLSRGKSGGIRKVKNFRIKAAPSRTSTRDSTSSSRGGTYKGSKSIGNRGAAGRGSGNRAQGKSGGAASRISSSRAQGKRGGGAAGRVSSNRAQGKAGGAAGRVSSNRAQGKAGGAAGRVSRNRAQGKSGGGPVGKGRRARKSSKGGKGGSEGRKSIRR